MEPKDPGCQGLAPGMPHCEGVEWIKERGKGEASRIRRACRPDSGNDCRGNTKTKPDRDRRWLSQGMVIKVTVEKKAKRAFTILEPRFFPCIEVVYIALRAYIRH